MNNPKKVLIIDDDKSIRDALRDMIEKKFSHLSIELLEAENGEAGLILAKQSRPDIILLDVIMPKMHGIDMLRQLKSDLECKKIPVVLLTNYADDPKVVAAVKEGICELLDKTKCKLQDVVGLIEKKFK